MAGQFREVLWKWVVSYTIPDTISGKQQPSRLHLPDCTCIGPTAQSTEYRKQDQFTEEASLTFGHKGC